MLLPLDATPLRRAAAIVRDRRHIPDHRDLDTRRLKRADRRLASGTGALDVDRQLTDTVFNCLLGAFLRGDLCREWRTLTRSTKTRASRGGPSQDISLPVSDRDDRIVERGMNMSNGFGQMSSYATQVPVEDRWAIAAYVRALQTSRYVDVKALSVDDRRQLEELE